MPRHHRGPIERPAPEHRVNQQIRIPEILVIGPDGDQLGVMSPYDGRARAAELGLDLVEVAPQSRPPVCRIMDYGKFKYERAKAASQSQSSQQQLKEIRIRPKTDAHDLDTKLNRAIQFLEKGDKVRIVMRLRGRERAYPGRWTERMLVHFEKLAEVGRIAAAPRAEGRTISMLVEPARS